MKTVKGLAKRLEPELNIEAHNLSVTIENLMDPEVLTEEEIDELGQLLGTYLAKQLKELL